MRLVSFFSPSSMAKMRYCCFVLALRGSYKHIFDGLDDAASMSMNVPNSNKKSVHNPYKRNKTITNPYKK